MKLRFQFVFMWKAENPFFLEMILEKTSKRNLLNSMLAVVRWSSIKCAGKLFASLKFSQADREKNMRFQSVVINNKRQTRTAVRYILFVYFEKQKSTYILAEWKIACS